MKFQITFKTPDVTYGIAKELCPPSPYDEEGDYRHVAQCNYEDRLYEISNQVDAIINKFVEYGELITIEFNLVLGTATVIPLRNK